MAYVKYEKASSAALAVENLHEVTLNGGQGPRLKVMLAESPHARYVCVVDENIVFQVFDGGFLSAGIIMCRCFKGILP